MTGTRTPDVTIARSRLAPMRALQYGARRVLLGAPHGQGRRHPKAAGSSGPREDDRERARIDRGGRARGGDTPRVSRGPYPGLSDLDLAAAAGRRHGTFGRDPCTPARE